MLQDPLFCDNNEVMIDELLTIFFAGSQTTAKVLQNLILQLCKHPVYIEKIVQEIKSEIGPINNTDDLLLKMDFESI